MEKNEALDFPNLGHRLIILDDDPTGIQAVQDCLVLTAWDTATLKTAFNDKVPFFFILTNTRALTTRDAKQRIAHVVTNVVKISLELKQQVAF